MKHPVLLVSLMVVPLFLMLSLPLRAQDATVVPEQPLSLGDSVSGTLEPRDRRVYPLNMADTGEPFDVVLFSTENGTLIVLDEQGERIRLVERMGGYGFEVFNWQPGDRMPAQIQVTFSIRGGDYSVSILPSEQGVSEAPRAGEQVKRWDVVEVSGGTRTTTIPYLLYVPEDYDDTQQYPFLLFMHGLGETGPRLDFLKTQVMPELIENGEDFPFIIASPQLAYGQFWGEQVDMVHGLVEYLQSEFPIDPDRITIAGLSLGGWGAWTYALQHPDVPAAVVSMAGWYNWGTPRAPDDICDLADVPMWVVHSEQDEVVSFTWEAGLVEALEACGGTVEFTILPDADHSTTFEQGFADPALYEWLWEQRK